MKVYVTSGNNFGDLLNAWLWPQLLELPVESYFERNAVFVGIGTLLGDCRSLGIDFASDPGPKVIFGSGAGYGRPPILDRRYRTYCVRGPLTAELLGLERDKAVTDPAVLLAEVIDTQTGVRKEVGLMMHHSTARIDNWAAVAAEMGLLYIDPEEGVSEVISKLRCCRLLVTEAMHGAIAADLFRIRWIPIRTRSLINEFKWRDWSASVGIQHKFEWLPTIWSHDIGSSFRVSSLKRLAHPVAGRLATMRTQVHAA